MSEARSCFPGAALCWNDRSDFPLDWNGPTNRPFDSFPDESKARPIVELLERVVCRFPERIALCGPEVSITYAELWRVLNGWAERIAAATAPGDLVGILVPVSPEFPIAMFACLAAGRPFVALDPDYPPDWIGQVLDDSRPAMLLVSKGEHGATEAIPHEKLHARHDDMLDGANAQAVANLLTRCLKSAAVAVPEASIERDHG